jgi:DNA polymerase elongation subunit (family B)
MRQALKLMTNTIYGAQGQTGSPLFCLSIPMVITATG